MYARRIQLINYGPMQSIDITFPFDGDKPKPVVVVGKNGAGKSNLLSHIVNGLIAAQGVAYPESREVQSGKVYKLRSNTYIAMNHDYYFGKVDYADGISVGEMRTHERKQQDSPMPSSIAEPDAQDAWRQMAPGDNDHFFGPVKDGDDERKIRDMLRTNCVLYFPPNRFEEPAWLNIDNLNARAEYMNLHHTTGYTDRNVIIHSHLQEIQRWLFEVIYDQTAFEVRTLPQDTVIQRGDEHISLPFTAFLGYQGESTGIYELALNIVRRIISRIGDIRFGIGRRQNRTISLLANEETVVPNIFQLSTGETALINLFLAMLRDVDLSDTPLTSFDSVKGIVVVDEIELHLHVTLQHDILPELISLFPNVQFIVTTQSPLFVLGMNRLFGSDGFGLYRLPEGQQIDPEEFSEFGSAYDVFAETSKFSDGVWSAIQDSQTPIVYVDGDTDVKYLKRAAHLLGRSALIDGVEVKPAGGEGNLRNIWKHARGLASGLVPQKVILLHDCDSSVPDAEDGKLVRRVVPKQNANPVDKGVENLFGEGTLKKAMTGDPAFVDVTPAHPAVQGGESITVPEQWVVNDNQKTNLCDWLCENGSADDFANFAIMLDLLEELLD